MSEIRKITLQFPSLRAFLAECGERVSGEGMLLRGDSPPAVGTTVDVEVVVAEGMRLLRARGEVLWSEAGAAGGRPKAAILRFREIDDASRTVIGKIVEQRRREGAEPFSLGDITGPREARLHDFTVPAAPLSAPPPPVVDADEGAIFDLARPPRAAASDQLPEPGGEAGGRPPPVPLLADPEPQGSPPAASEAEPFDLQLEPATGEREAAGEGLELDSAPGVDDPGSDVGSNLDDLFGGDEPLAAPARGRTEAFPPSFLDEVEAELQGTGAPASAEPQKDVAEPEMPVGPPIVAAGADAAGEIEAEPRPQATPQAAPSFEARAASDIRSEDGRDVEPEVAPAGDLEPTSELDLADEPESATGPEAEAEPRADLDLEREAAVQQTADSEPDLAVEPAADLGAGFDLAVEPAADLGAGFDLAGEAAADLGAGFELAVEPATDVEPEPEAATDVEPEPEAATDVEPEPELAAEAAGSSQPGTEPEVPAEPVSPADVERPTEQAVEEEQGPETVEIPLATRRPMATPPQPPPVDDNLLTIPELGPGSAPAKPSEAPAALADLPSSAQSLRGAASSSRHLGTWLLIALLVAALGVAGYFLLGLIRGGGAASSAGLPAGGSASEPASSPPSVPAGGDSSGGVATAGAQAAEETAAGTAEETAAGAAEETALTTAPPAVDGDPTAAAVDPAPSEGPAPAGTGPDTAPVPVTPLTGVDRITWSESGEQTVLTLVGDGEISRQQVELVPISGGQPRLVIKIRGVSRPFQPAVLEVGTAQVLRVRTGLHAGGELHVVVDLAAPGVSVRDLAPRGSRLEVRLGNREEG